MGKLRAALIAVVALGLALPAIGQASRKPTVKEGIQIATVVHLPIRCAKVRISTETKKPKWGKVSFRPKGDSCDAFASNGVSVVKKSSGRWRFITAGSSFECGELYKLVPKAIANDLGIDCFTQ
jgi:hypothetical protein